MLLFECEVFYFCVDFLFLILNGKIVVEVGDN